MTPQAYDLIGDIHGQHEKLVTILRALGYRARGDFAGWSHPEGRKVIFLGDYIDRGPAVRAVLHDVRGMVEAGDALAIMGNHELYAILNEADGTKPPPELRATQGQFAGRELEWAGFVAWMGTLPLFIDLGEVRAVHACWDARVIADLRGQSDLTPELLEACPMRNSRERKAVDRLLDGPVLPVPDDALVLNSKGMPLSKVRVRWWNLPISPYAVSDLVLPESLGGRGTIEPDALVGVPDYPADDPPVFFGHYWLPMEHRKAPLTPNLACLDFSAGRGDAPLVAYRWDGEQILSEAKFFVPNHI